MGTNRFSEALSLMAQEDLKALARGLSALVKAVEVRKPSLDDAFVHSTWLMLFSSFSSAPTSSPKCGSIENRG